MESSSYIESQKMNAINFKERQEARIKNKQMKLKQAYEKNELSFAERKRLRNNISAQQNHILKKRERSFLLSEIEKKNKIFKKYVNSL